MSKGNGFEIISEGRLQEGSKSGRKAKGEGKECKVSRSQ